MTGAPGQSPALRHSLMPQVSNFNSLGPFSCENCDNNIQLSRSLGGCDYNRVCGVLRQGGHRVTARGLRNIPILFSGLPQSCPLGLDFCRPPHEHESTAWDAFRLLPVAKPSELSRCVVEG